MGRGTVLVSLIVLIGSIGAFAPVTSAQTGLYPEIILTCDEPNEQMEVYPGATRTLVVNCVVENPTIHQEKVDVAAQSSSFDAVAPQSITIGAGAELSFQVIFRGEETQAPGQYPVNITAKVIQANGIDVSLITSEEIVEMTIEVAAFMSCDWTMGQGGGTVEAGDVIVFSTSFSCSSNDDSVANFSPIMISDSGDNSWPSGFVDQSAPCNVQIQSGGSSTNCQFQILTPSNLGETWDGCIRVVWEEDWLDYVPNSCQYERIDVKIEPKTIGIGIIDLTGNDSIFGDYSEEAPVIIGGVVVVIVLAIAVVVIRRRRRSFDD